MTLELIKETDHKWKTNWPQPVKVKALKLIRAGFTFGEIRRILGVPTSTARGWAREAGIEARSPGGVRNKDRTPHEVIAKACFMYDRMGMNSIEVAKELGYKHYGSVTRLLKKGGVEVRSRSERNRRRAA